MTVVSLVDRTSQYDNDYCNLQETLTICGYYYCGTKIPSDVKPSYKESVDDFYKVKGVVATGMSIVQTKAPKLHVKI